MKKNEYRNLNPKDTIKIIKFFPNLLNTTLFIKENLIGKAMYILTEETYVKLVVTESNFMHLCGIEYREGANKFFNACLNNKLEINSIKIKNDGTTYQKLKVINQLENLFSNPCQLTTGNSYLKLQFDAAIRTRKQIVALAMGNNRDSYYPLSLLDLKGMRHFETGDKVICIYTIDLLSNTLTTIFKEKEWNVIECKSEKNGFEIKRKKKEIFINITI